MWRQPGDGMRADARGLLWRMENTTRNEEQAGKSPVSNVQLPTSTREGHASESNLTADPMDGKAYRALISAKGHQQFREQQKGPGSGHPAHWLRSWAKKQRPAGQTAPLRCRQTQVSAPG